eukprot:snap_masked-scaffold_5-processed-gene-6.0-mRNA-1 protein AED:1.00 eAED:1.00 QI:0/-1/0/0/-1/1/1/0/273
MTAKKEIDVDILNLTEALDEKIENDKISTARRDRLMRNREIARNCRKRKREKISLLQGELTRLRSNLSSLQAELATAQAKNGAINTGRANRKPQDEARRQEEVEHIHKLATLKENLTPQEQQEQILPLLQQHSECWSDSGSVRRGVLSELLDKVKTLCIPSQVNKMLIWLLQSGGDTELMAELKAELGLTEEQKSNVMSMAADSGEEATIELFRSVEEVKHKMMKVLTHRDNRMKALMQQITPVQQAKFLHWIERNRACIELLDSVWREKTES